MQTTLSSKGQIVLPAELLDQDRLMPGQEFKIQRVQPGQYLLTRRPDQENLGIIEWLQACPEKGAWFEPVGSESTHTL